jgi:hypothetical protein
MNPVTTFIGLNEKRFFKETGLFPFARIREPGPGGPPARNCAVGAGFEAVISLWFV